MVLALATLTLLFPPFPGRIHSAQVWERTGIENCLRKVWLNSLRLHEVFGDTSRRSSFSLLNELSIITKESIAYSIQVQKKAF